MKRPIAGSRALITGASSGIGMEIARALAAEGGDLVLFARREDRLEELAGELRKLGRCVVPVAGDVTEADARQRAIAAAISNLGGLDILVNNAGVSAHGRFADAAPERFRRIMEVNFFAAAEMIRASLPSLREGRHPIVVNVGSILGHLGIPHMSEYCASKFALRGLNDSLRAELSKQSIDVLLVSPGTTETEFFDSLIERQNDLPWGRQQGVPAAYVAKATVRAIRRGKREIIPNRQGRWLVRLKRFTPWLIDRIMKRYG